MNNSELTYKIIRSRRRTLAIHVTRDADVVVRAPLALPLREIEKFIAVKRAWIEQARQKVLARNENDPPMILTAEREQTFRARAQEVIHQKVAYYSGIMGVTPSRVRINGAKGRYGSCSGKNSLNFSWRLMMADDDAIDYVVVHELAHILEHNHSADFWAAVESVLPDYEERRKKLKSARYTQGT